VAAVELLFATVRRWSSPAAGLLAGVILALTLASSRAVSGERRLRPNAASGHLSGCPPTARTLAIARSLCEPASEYAAKCGVYAQ